MEITLESLGLTKKALEEKVIELAVEKLLSGVTYDEYGNVETVDSGLQKKMRKLIIERIDETISIFAEKYVLPKVSDYIQNINLQETNKWGEKKNEKLTFIEYLIQRAEVYMKEPVDSYGYSQEECRTKRDTWYGSKSMRIEFMIDKYLHNSIESAMKDALSIANKALVTGIQETVKMKLEEIVKSIKIGIKV